MLRFLARIAVPVLCMGFCGTCTELSQFIQGFGYTELRPPSTLLTPGTMVVVRGNHPFEGKIVCSAEESLGPDLKLIRSRTARSSVLKSNKFSLNFEASLLEEVKGDARFDGLSDVSLRFENPEVLTLKDSDIERLAKNRTRECRRAIARRVAQGYDVTMISSVIMGDMVIKADWKKDSKLDASAKVETLQHLALEFGQEAANSGENVISAKGLVWGVADDKYLAALTIDRDVLTDDQVALIERKERAIQAPTATLASRSKGKVAIVEHHHARPIPTGAWRRHRQEVAPADILESQTDIAANVEYEDPVSHEEFTFTPPGGLPAPHSEGRKLRRYKPDPAVGRVDRRPPIGASASRASSSR